MPPAAPPLAAGTSAMPQAATLTTSTRLQCDARGRAGGAYQNQCNAPGCAAAAVTSIDLLKCSHAFHTYGDIMSTFFGAIAASPIDLFK